MGRDLIHFMLVLYLIYWGDSFVYARSSEWILYAPWRGMKWRIKSTGPATSIGGRFWVLRPLLPPLGSSFRLPVLRCSLGQHGVCSASPLSRSARMGGEVRYLEYDAVESVGIREDELVVNGESWFKGTAHELAEAQSAIEAMVSAKDRAAAVRDWIETRFSLAQDAVVRIGDLERRTWLLNLLCSVYAIWLLLFLPAALYLFPPMRLLWNVAVPLLVLHLLTGFLFLWVHGQLLPAQRYARWETFFKMLFCPPMMVRACDPFNDHAGVPGDALAVLLATVEERRWRDVVRPVWRCLIPAPRPSLPPEAANAMNEYAAVYRTVLAAELGRRGIEASAFDVDVSGIRAGDCVCPSCGTVYRSEVPVCADCGDVPLLEGKGELHVS